MTSSPGTGARVASLLLASVVLGCAVAGCASGAGQPATSDRPLLDVVAEQIGLPAQSWTASGTHTAKGYVSEDAKTSSVEGMKADCDNINLNKKLAGDFRSDVFGPGMKGFFYKCEKVAADTNQYWFTISSADKAQIDKLCDPATSYPIVYDQQHDAYWRDEPFTCTSRVGPT